MAASSGLYKITVYAANLFLLTQRCKPDLTMFKLEHLVVGIAVPLIMVVRYLRTGLQIR